MEGSHNKLTIFQRIGLEIMWQLMRFFAVLPYWFKYYVVENLLFVIFYYILRYRINVVRENLRNSFPEKSDSERFIICRRFYFTLSEMFVNTINLAHMPDRKIRRLFEVEQVEAHKTEVRGRDWIALTAHFGCWEYCNYWGVYERTQIVGAVYHPLRSAMMDELFKRLRAKSYSRTVAMNDTMRFYLRAKDRGIEGCNIALGLIADQNPPLRPESHWFRFLNQDTIFFDGGEKLAMRCKLPIYFIKMTRRGRGKYLMTLRKLYDGVEVVAPHEITGRYVRALEEMIREVPELWMWSHRRWKHVRPPQ